MFFYLEDPTATIPPGTTHLQVNVSCMKVTKLPALPAGLLSIVCAHNNLEELPTLPEGLLSLTVYGNKLTALPELPASLKVAFLHDNALNAFYGVMVDEYERTGDIALLRTRIHNHHRKEQHAFRCHGTDEDRLTRTEVPPIPEDTALIDILNLLVLTSVPPLPKDLLAFSCCSTSLGTLPELPASLLKLDVSFSKITSLPDHLPPGLETLDVTANMGLTSLPPLPETLVILYIPFTGITTIPKLPKKLRVLNAHNAPLVEPFASYVAEYGVTHNTHKLIEQVNSQHA